MSGVELLPFVWALPVAYIAASYGVSREEQGKQRLAPPGHLSLDREYNERLKRRGGHENECDGFLDDEAIEVFLERKGCACFMA